MTDLNEWRLAYGDTTFDFGTLDSDYPLQTQVDIGDLSGKDQDADHPTSDGVVMGRDSLGGFTLTFEVTTIPEFPLTGKPWSTALDLVSAFIANWRADSIRRIPGEYATLTNLDRGRLVYGRPRKVARKLDRARKGQVGAIGTFQTIDPNFYAADEKVATITPGPPVSEGGFEFPLTFPLTTVGWLSDTEPTNNEGDLEAWPVIEFHGPGKDFSLELVAPGESLWTLKAVDPLKSGQVLRIDTRPWSRSATLNGKPANGRIRGTQIEKCMIPVGTFDAIFNVSDPSGTAHAVVSWRDAYASL